MCLSIDGEIFPQSGDIDFERSGYFFVELDTLLLKVVL